MSKFTKCTWSVWGTGDFSSCVRTNKDRRDICEINPPKKIEETEEVDANARLIAAAPEMYELLKTLMMTDNLDEANMACSQIDKLLKKVDGE